MANNQRSRTAILSGAKIVITEVGSYESNMNDIAARAEVSRATVYNHFSDKEEMMISLVESEIRRLYEVGKKAPISRDPALRKMVVTDPLDIAKFVTVTGHPLWTLIKGSLDSLFGESSGAVLHWLIGQIASPLTPAESAKQADQMVRTL
jgi:hypothetical protein